MSTADTLPIVAEQTVLSPVASAVREGLLAHPKRLAPWLFYDSNGSNLFEQITALPEYYPTRTERAIFRDNASNVVQAALDIGLKAHRDGPLRFLELGAGSASKTGILLAAAVQEQGTTEYLPIDVSESALEEARCSLLLALPELLVRPQIANYVTDRLIVSPYAGATLALYIGSSIGNFDPNDGVAVLRNLRKRLHSGDSLLLGTDLVKASETLLAAYNDASGVTATFNLNMLQRINRELDANFDLTAFQHNAIWNAEASRIEMHLCSKRTQTVYLRALNLHIHFAAGETIHTENSYKFTPAAITSMLQDSGFTPVQTWRDQQNWFAVTLAAAT